MQNLPQQSRGSVKPCIFQNHLGNLLQALEGKRNTAQKLQQVSIVEHSSSCLQRSAVLEYRFSDEIRMVEKQTL